MVNIMQRMQLLFSIFTLLFIFIFMKSAEDLKSDVPPLLSYNIGFNTSSWEEKIKQFLTLKTLTQGITNLGRKKPHPVEKILLKKFLKFEKLPIENTFKNILIVINFNHPHYVNIPLVHEMYDNVFGKVVVCGPEESPKNDVDIVLEHFKGYLGYHCAAKAMELYSNYEGYLYGSDDMIINWWMLTSLSKTKIWLGSNATFFKQNIFQPIKDPYFPNGKGHWEAKWGVPACKQIYNFILTVNGTTHQKFLSNYLHSCNDEPCCYQSRSDLFYIPRRLKNDFIELSTKAFEYKFFLEFAVPTLLIILDQIQNFEILNGVYARGHSLHEFGKKYDFDITFIHPFKYSKDGATATTSRKILKEFVIKYTEILLQ